MFLSASQYKSIKIGNEWLLMQLDITRQEEIFRDGFIVLRGAVSPLLVRQAM